MKKAFEINLIILLIYFAFFITFFFLRSYNHGLANIAIIVLNLGLISYLIIFKKIDFENITPFIYKTKTLYYGIFPLFFLATLLQLFIDPLRNLSFVTGTELIRQAKLPLPNFSYFYLFYTIIFAPIVEEFVFRKYLLTKTIFYTKNINISILMTSVIFGFIHLPNAGMCIIAFVFSIFCSMIYIKYKNIIFPIIFHITFNSVGVLLKSVLITKYYDTLLYLNFGLYYWFGISFVGIALLLLLYFHFKKFAA
ncbi:CPBP family intramembrane metalloprotease [Kriegella sp. EG-1]|nr:CPBP family intramembrane metalloprotease [Flavobacteriaceae bacterium EG-1]